MAMGAFQNQVPSETEAIIAAGCSKAALPGGNVWGKCLSVSIV